MKPNVINPFLVGSRSLHAEMRSIEGELAQSPISQKKYQVLTQKLDRASKKLDDLEKTSGVFAKAQTDYLKEKVVALSKDLVDGRVAEEISRIQKETSSLRTNVSRKAVKQLDAHIKELEKNHKPSIPHRRIIADAKNTLEEAKAKLEGKPVDKHFDFLAEQKQQVSKEGIELLPGEVEELFDIAKAIYDRDFRQAKIRFNQLSEDHKHRFKKHMQHLTAKPFEDALETMQALIGTVNELVENGEGYPTQEQIDRLFLGLSQVLEEERAEGKVLPFDARKLGA